jgi:hypothetical protein
MDTEIDGLTMKQLDGNEVYHLHFRHLESDFFVTDSRAVSQDLWVAAESFYPVKLLETYSFGPEGPDSTEARTVKRISMINETFEIVPPI